VAFEVVALRLGLLEVPKSLNSFGLSADAGIETVPIMAYLVRDGYRCVLVDCGVPPADECAKRHRRIVDGSRMDVGAALHTVGCSLSDLAFVVLTHLHWDHLGCMDEHPDVEVCVQRRELEYAAAPAGSQRRGYGLPADRERHSPRWSARSYRIFDGAVGLGPGLRVIPTPGHTPGSQSLLVRTSQGSAAIVGDTVPVGRNVQEQCPPGVHVSIGDWRSSMALLLSSADEIYCGHDETPVRTSKFKERQRLEET